MCAHAHTHKHTDMAIYCFQMKNLKQRLKKVAIQKTKKYVLDKRFMVTLQVIRCSEAKHITRINKVTV